MAVKLTVADWSTTPLDNDNIGGTPLGENVTRPQHVNNALREMMAQIATVGLPTIGPKAAKASLRNRIVNGDKLVSQENGQTAGTTNGRYISDQNAMYFVTSAGTFTGVNVLTLSPAGGYRDRITITTADASLAAGENLTYTQNIEGSSVRDLKWGTAGAVAIVVRRGFKFPAGTWPIAFHNSAANRSYVTTFTVSALEANTDIVREFAIPGDTSGTWLTADGVIGLTMDVVIGAGSTFQGVAGWQAGNVLTVAGATNGMALSGAIFEVFDEGLKADPDATGVYGQYEVGEVDAVYCSERYFERLYNDIFLGDPNDQVGRGVWFYKLLKGKVPTISLVTSNASTVTNVGIDSAGFIRVGSFALMNAGTTANARLS